MRIGITAFLTDRSIRPAEWAKHVEQRGFNSLFLPEHTHLPVSEDTPPAVVEGVNPDDYPRSLDPFVALASAASVTTSLKLGTGVSLVAQHDPITLAKQIATLDNISGGRFVLGVGFGWNKTEAADHGIKFNQRREVAREKVLCMRELWSKERAEFHGRHVELPPSFAWPKPEKGIPILVGGAAGPLTFEAIAEYADGWMPIGGAGIGRSVQSLREAFDASGRDPSSIEVVPFGTIPSTGKLEHLAEAGCTEVVLRVRAADEAEMLRCLDDYSSYLEEGWATGE
ncbi:MAG: LLM class F420-dependent oxidoreductase [Acidimicrobiales bacterium]